MSWVRKEEEETEPRKSRRRIDRDEEMRAESSMWSSFSSRNSLSRKLTSCSGDGADDEAGIWFLKKGISSCLPLILSEERERKRRRCQALRDIIFAIFWDRTVRIQLDEVFCYCFLILTSFLHPFLLLLAIVGTEDCLSFIFFFFALDACKTSFTSFVSVVLHEEIRDIFLPRILCSHLYHPCWHHNHDCHH